MSSDATARRKARENQMAMDMGDMTGARVAGMSQARAGNGLAGFVAGLIGEWIYIEGVRLNWRGKLEDVYIGGDGQPTAVLLDPCIRVGEWGDQPTAQYEETMHGPHVVTWGSIIDFGRQMKAWPKASNR